LIAIGEGRRWCKKRGEELSAKKLVAGWGIQTKFRRGFGGEGEAQGEKYDQFMEKK